MTTKTSESVLHIRYKGTSRDIPIRELSCEDTASDKDVKNAVAAFLDLGEDHDLGDYVLARHQNGNMTLRPEAVFGAE